MLYTAEIQGEHIMAVQYLFTITKCVCASVFAHTPCACVWHRHSLILPSPLSISKESPKREWRGECVHAREEGRKVGKKSGRRRREKEEEVEDGWEVEGEDQWSVKSVQPSPSVFHCSLALRKPLCPQKVGELAGFPSLQFLSISSRFPQVEQYFSQWSSTVWREDLGGIETIQPYSKLLMAAGDIGALQCRWWHSR